MDKSFSYRLNTSLPILIVILSSKTSENTQTETTVDRKNRRKIPLLLWLNQNIKID